MTPGSLDITVYKGITLDPIIFNVKDGTGAAINLNGWQVFAKSRNGTGKLIDLGPTITNPTAGQVTISLDSTETATFTLGQQQWDMLFQKPTGEKLGPYISGTITVLNTVTNA
jgi:hypothetical protein